MLALQLAQGKLSQNQSEHPTNSQAQHNLPDAPSAVQPPATDFFGPNEIKKASSIFHTDVGQSQVQKKPSTFSNPKNQINPQDDIYKILVSTNLVQIPVTVTNSHGQFVDGLLPGDFTVKEDGKPQKLALFTSDPFQLSVAIVLDLGLADVAIQKIHQTYDSLAAAFSPYDEFALYTYSSTVSQVTDFTNHVDSLIAALDSIKPVRGRNNGTAVLGGPFGPQPPMVNGFPIGTVIPPPVMTPAKESHVLNDAILRATLDLSRRDRTRRKVILVISDGRERGSQASFGQAVKLLQTHGIQVKGLVVDQGALPVYKQVEKIHHVLWQGYANILPKYAKATGGGTVFSAVSRNSIEQAYAAITYEARNQYTLGYISSVGEGGGTYRSVEVIVNRKNLKVYTKNGYYPAPRLHQVRSESIDEEN